MSKNKLLFLVGLLLPVIIVFRSIFVPGAAVWGDAPYFYPEGLRELLREPLAWTVRAEPLGEPNIIVWLSPIMMLYGWLHSYLGFTNDLIIRILFYLPAVVGALITPIFVARYFRLPAVVQFFSALVYVFCTYFILLVDGGQVGVAAAYGLFPLTVIGIRSFVDYPSWWSFVGALGAFFVVGLYDIRLSFIGFVTHFVLTGAEALVTKSIKIRSFLLPIGLAFFIIVLSAYWFLPLLGMGGIASVAVDSTFHPVTLLDSILLFQPHWPLNEFGRVFEPPFYFIGVSLLVFGSLLVSKQRIVRWTLVCFLVFAFLAKGESPPFGNWYVFVLNNFPYTTAFRDSTKFFAPLVLFGGLLIGMTLQTMIERFKKSSWRWIIMGAAYIYLLMLVAPALRHQLDGVLAIKYVPFGFELVRKHIINENSFFRTAWFPERHPFTFQTYQNPALDAKQLVAIRPLSSLNVGTLDRFNFLHNDQFVDWFNLLGIRYLIFSGDPRVHELTKENQTDWNNLLQLVSTKLSLVGQQWNTGFPVYKISNTKPHIFTVDRALVVAGGEDIYDKLKKIDPEFSVGNQAFIFLEDGKVDPVALGDIPSQSATVVLNGKTDDDITMSFLQKYFVSPQRAVETQWAMYSSDNYLKWKYELLIRGIDTQEFDYGRGIAFSSVDNEKIIFQFDVPESGEYVLAARTLRGGKNDVLTVNLSGERSIKRFSQHNFEWFIQKVSLQKGKQSVTFVNKQGLHVINTVTLVPESEWQKAKKQAHVLLNRFAVVDVQENDTGELKKALGKTWHAVDYTPEDTTDYLIANSQQGQWLIFTDAYNPKWRLKDVTDHQMPYPLYSVINGYYLAKPGIVELIFYGQEPLRRGKDITVGFLLLLAVVFIWQYAKRRR